MLYFQLKYIQNKDYVFFEYILIGNKASISKLTDFCDGFFNNERICKLFISAHLNISTFSAHNNALTNCYKFLIHDYNHITYCIDFLSSDDFKTYRSQYSIFSKNRNLFRW